MVARLRVLTDIPAPSGPRTGGAGIQARDTARAWEGAGPRERGRWPRGAGRGDRRPTGGQGARACQRHRGKERGASLPCPGMAIMR